MSDSYQAAYYFARAIIAARDEELRKQEPDIYVSDAGSAWDAKNNPEFANNPNYTGYYEHPAPIPPTISTNVIMAEIAHHEEMLKGVAPLRKYHIERIAHLRSGLDDATLIPTPSQLLALVCVNVIGTPAEVVPMDRDSLRAFILARPDTEVSKP